MSRSKTAPLSTFAADRYCRRLWPLTVNALSILCAERSAYPAAPSAVGFMLLFGGTASSEGSLEIRRQMVGIVPPSMTYSLPLMADARSEARNATSSATSSGRFGRPSGIPPSASMMRCRAASVLLPVRCAISLTIPSAAWVSV